MTRARIFRILAVFLLLAVAFVAGWFVGRTGLGQEVDPETLPVAERLFIEQMNGAALVGYFTIEGRGSRTTEDRYDIYSVEKVGDNQWRFNAKIGETGLTLPIVVRMYFVSSTPMIVMDGLSIPGMGMFSGRVVFHEDQYVGTWSHLGKGGGQMFGRIERGAAQQ